MISDGCTPSWRTQCSAIVESLFEHTPTYQWNTLLDLRQHLLYSHDWNQILDLFLACRQELEEDHYLPFYRLRRILSASLSMEARSNSVSVDLSQTVPPCHASLLPLIANSLMVEC